MYTKPLYDDDVWDELCSDPLYPCGRCTKCNAPRTCHTKDCVDWREWWKLRYSQARRTLKNIKRGKVNV